MKNKKWIIIAVAVLLLLTVVKDFIIKTAMTTVGSSVVGAKIEVSYFSVGLFTSKVHMRNFKLYNPPGFPNEPMVNMPEIRVDYDVPAFLGGKIHAPLVVFNMKEMNVIKNKEGKLNVDSLKIIEEQKAAADKKQEPQKQQTKPMPIRIDLLRLNVERVVFKDYSKGGDQPVVQVYEIDLKNKEFKDIKSVQQMITLILIQAMGPTAAQSVGMYAAATVLGIGFLPAGVIGAIVAKDDSIAEFSQGIDKVYSAALKVLKQMGEVKTENKSQGLIKAKVSGADITVKVEKGEDRKTKINVQARQFMLPKPEIAGGIVYKLKQELK